jgi:hypothetical protein
MNNELYVALVDDSQSPFGYFHYHDHHSDPAAIGESLDIAPPSRRRAIRT